MQRLISCLSIVDRANKAVGENISFLIYVLIGVIGYEVIMRYVFNAPTAWAHDVSGHVFAAFAVLGAGYVLSYQGHVNMDVLTKRMPPKISVIVNLVTYLLFFFYCAVLIWKGINFASTSIMLGEVTTTPAAIPVYPIKMIIPIGALLLFLQGLVFYIRQILVVINRDKG